MKTRIRSIICVITLWSASVTNAQTYHFPTVFSPVGCANTYEIDITLRLDSVTITNIYFDDGTNGSLGFKAWVSYQNVFTNSNLPAGTFFTYQFSLFTNNPNINPQELTNNDGNVPLQTATQGGLSFMNNPTFNASASAMGVTLNGSYSDPSILSQLGYDSATLQINLPCLDTLLTDGSGVLPVLWSDVSGAVRGREVSLEWQTFMEQNNLGFSIERSVDGTNWQSIGFINSRAPGGNSDDLLSYQYRYTEQFEGRYLYRVIQKDIDGRFVISNIVRVSISSQHVNDLMVYPNPSNGIIYLQNTAANTKYTINDGYGRMVSQGYYQGRIDVSKLSPGMYWIRTETQASRFMIIKGP